MKKNNTTEKSIVNAEKLAKALKEGTEKTLRNLVNEALSNIILESEEDEAEEEPIDTEKEEDVVDDNSFEVEDVDVEGEEDEADADTTEVEDEEGQEDGEEEDEWAEFDEFKTGDNDYDFTGEDDENAGEKLLKMFSKIDDGDQLIVTRDGNQLEISDEETGTEDVIELEFEDDEEVAPAEDDFEMEEPEIELGDEENETEEGETDLGDEVDDDDEELEFEFDVDELDESFGYTDNYQSKTAMTTPPNKEVANPNDTYSMDDVPEGDGKRWSNKKDQATPFEDKVCEGEEMTEEPELEEAATVGGDVQLRSSSKSKVPAGRKEYVPKGTRHASFGSEYTEVVESLNKIKEENKALKECLKKYMNSLKEAAVLNVNLGKVVRLLSEETTTKDEKKSILKRFNDVKTINEGNTLYETIKGELKENKKSAVVLENKISVAEKTNLNETTIFNRSENPSLSLMDRMDNLWKK